MRRKYDSGYEELLIKVKEKLPKCYGVLVSNKHPDISRSRCYNIMSHGIQDWDALRAMADTFGVEEIIKVENTKETV
jgi:hypothetical protein